MEATVDDDGQPDPPADESPSPSVLRRGITSWRSPADQPWRARPALLGITVLACLFYGWGSAGNLEIFYAASVRSMSTSWHTFFFAAFDPAGTVTVDKLPGALWFQALSVRLFGLHDWALVLPQVIEGAMTILVLFRVVRRLAGPGAALIAVGVLALSPASVALDRGNISDTLMILCLVLATDRVVAAVAFARLRSLLVASVWVGAAFQAKMLEAWLLLPTFALIVLVSFPASRYRRLFGVAVLGVGTAVVSLSWMTVVSLVPASDRPYVDGSQHDSLFAQVFVYNGFGRVDQVSPNQLLSATIGVGLRPGASAGVGRLLNGAYGRDTAWLLPLALAAVLGLLVTRRARLRTDPVVTLALLFGGWLLTLWAVFSASSSINAYYAAALSPAVAALVGTATVECWRFRALPRVQVLVVGACGVTAGYGSFLVGTGPSSFITRALTIVLAFLAVGCVLAGVSRVAGWHTVPLRSGLLLAVLATFLAPAVASISLVTASRGPFDTPFEGPAAARLARSLYHAGPDARQAAVALERLQFGAPDLMATQTSALAAPFIYDTGLEVLPIGGFTGTIPAPTAAKLQALIAAGRFHVVIVGASSTDSRVRAVEASCQALPQRSGTNPKRTIYLCGLPALTGISPQRSSAPMPVTTSAATP